MNKLDHFFRSWYQRPARRAAQPPADGWARLAEQLARANEGVTPPPLPPSTTGRYRRWGGGLLLLLAVGLTALWWSPPRAAAAPQLRAFPIQLPTEPEARRQAYYAAAQPNEAPQISISSSQASRPTVSTTAPTEAAQVTESATALSATNSSTMSSSPTSASTTTPTTADVAPPRSPQQSVTPQQPQPSAPVAVASPVVVSPMIAQPQSLAPSPYLDRAVASLDPVRALATPYRSRRTPWRFEQIERGAQPPRMWEVSAMALPWLVRDWQSGNSLVDEPDPSISEFPQRYILNDGRSVDLYYGRSSAYFSLSSRYFAPAIMGVEIARRTSSGFRFSLGGTYIFSNGAGGKRRLSDYAESVPSDGYLVVTRNTHSYTLWMTAGAQYTINRRRRFRIHAGLQFMTPLYERYGREEVLIQGDPLQEHFVSRTTFRSSDFLDWVVPAPQVTFEYQLRRNIGLTLGLGPQTGFGLNYQFGQRYP